MNSYLEVSDAALRELQMLCRRSSLADPVIVFYGASSELPKHLNPTELRDVAGEVERVRSALRQDADTILPELTFKLVVDCVERKQLPPESIIQIGEIAINAAAPGNWSKHLLLLDYREREFVLVDEAGKNVLDYVAASVRDLNF